MSTEQLSSAPVVLRAKPTPKWPGFLFLVQLWVPLAVASVYFWGLSGLVKLTALVMVAGAYYLFLRRFVPDELTFDEEGVVLQSARKGFLAPRPVSFRWEEVEAVRRAGHCAGSSLAIRVGGRPRSVMLRPGQWQDDRFIESVRRHVSPEKILPKALEPGPVAPWVTVLCKGILLACFAALAVTSVLFVSEPAYSGFVAAVVAMVCCALGAFALWSAVDGPSGVGTVVAGGLAAMALLSSLLILLGLVGATGMCTAVGGLGGAAGLLLGPAVLVFLGPRVRWPHVALFYSLGLAGWVVGVLGWDGIPSQVNYRKLLW